MLVGFSGAVAGHPLHGSEIGDGIAHPFARGAQFGHAGAGPQDLARHRGQQLARCGPAQTAQRLRAPALHPHAGHQHRPGEGAEIGACGAVAPTTTPMDPGPGPAASLAAPTWSTTNWATLRPSAAAFCTAAPSGLEVAASTNTPRPWAAATSSSGRSEPKPK